MLERWKEIRKEITESTSVWDVYRPDSNRLTKFLEKLGRRIFKLEETEGDEKK